MPDTSFQLFLPWWQDNIDSQWIKFISDRLEEGYTCLRGPRPSGAMLLTEVGNSIYGGVYPPNGSLSCKEVGECMIVDGHCVRNVHAEVFTVLYAARKGYSTENSTLYSWNKPCYNCTIVAIEAGVKRIVYVHVVYDEERTKQAIENAGVICEQFEGFRYFGE